MLTTRPQKPSFLAFTRFVISALVCLGTKCLVLKLWIELRNRQTNKQTDKQTVRWKGRRAFRTAGAVPTAQFRVLQCLTQFSLHLPKHSSIKPSDTVPTAPATDSDKRICVKDLVWSEKLIAR